MQRIPEISNSYSLIEEIVFGFTQSVNQKKYIDMKNIDMISGNDNRLYYITRNYFDIIRGEYRPFFRSVTAFGSTKTGAQTLIDQLTI